MPDARPPSITFYKRLHSSFVYEFKFTKLTQKVYVNKGMSLLTFSLILTHKMAARVIFEFFFFIFQNPLTLAVLQLQFSTFQEKLTIIRGCWRKVFLEGVCVCVCVHWFGGLNLLFLLFSTCYYRQISQIFRIASLALGTVYEKFCPQCSHWLSCFWS